MSSNTLGWSETWSFSRCPRRYVPTPSAVAIACMCVSTYSATYSATSGVGAGAAYPGAAPGIWRLSFAEHAQPTVWCGR